MGNGVPDNCRCPTCHERLNAVTSIASDDDALPEVGSISVCFYCGSVLVFCEDCLELATVEEVFSLPATAVILLKITHDKIVENLCHDKTH